MVKIKDIHGEEYNIHNLDSFIEHVDKFHTIDGMPDNSIHEENGYYFKIDTEFYNILKSMK